MPTISASFGAQLTTVTHWLVTSYLIVNLVGQTPGGRVVDALGQLRAIRLGMALQAIGLA
jgi:MFS family permease